MNLITSVTRIKEMNEIKTPNGNMLYTRASIKGAKKFLNSRYLSSHYEVTKPVIDPSHIDSRNHKDKLFNITSDERILDLFNIKENDFVIECGAYEGFGTNKLTELVGRSGHVIAIEGDPENYRTLELNTKNLWNVTTVEAAILDKEGPVLFHKRNRSNKGNTIHKPHRDTSHLGKPYTVQGTTLDILLKRLEINLNLPTHLILEINLAELEALKGAETLLRTNKNLRIISAGWFKRNKVHMSKYLKNYLESLGYTVLIGTEHRVYAYKE